MAGSWEALILIGYGCGVLAVLASIGWMVEMILTPDVEPPRWDIPDHWG